MTFLNDIRRDLDMIWVDHIGFQIMVGFPHDLTFTSHTCYRIPMHSRCVNLLHCSRQHITSGYLPGAFYSGRLSKHKPFLCDSSCTFEVSASSENKLEGECGISGKVLNIVHISSIAIFI
jgi:hypothetical protein